MPLIVIIPGIAMYVLFKNGHFSVEMMGPEGQIAPDKAYPTLLNLLPIGLKGLSFAALTAAIVASLAGKLNSIATIFTFDIYKKVIVKSASEKQQVRIGQIAVMAAMLIAVIIAPFLGIDKGGLNYIQEYTGFVSPGIFAMFLLGFFWKRTTSNAALFCHYRRIWTFRTIQVPPANNGFVLALRHGILKIDCGWQLRNSVSGPHGICIYPLHRGHVAHFHDRKPQRRQSPKARRGHRPVQGLQRLPSRQPPDRGRPRSPVLAVLVAECQMGNLANLNS